MCAACGKKYVRQTAWGSVKERFLSNSEAYAQDKAERLAALVRTHALEATDPRRVRKEVFDPRTETTREAPLFATFRGEEEREAVWAAFTARTAEDSVRREHDYAAMVRRAQGAASAIDPECTFEPKLVDLSRAAVAFPHLKATAERLAHQGFEERCEETVGRRVERKALAQQLHAPDLSHLPEYHPLRKGSRGWLTEQLKRPTTMPGYFDAEDSGFGGNLLAHGPFDTDRFTGAPTRPDPRSDPPFNPSDQRAARASTGGTSVDRIGDRGDGGRGAGSHLADAKQPKARCGWAKEDKGGGHVRSEGQHRVKQTSQHRAEAKEGWDRPRFEHKGATGDGWIED